MPMTLGTSMWSYSVKNSVNWIQLSTEFHSPNSWIQFTEWLNLFSNFRILAKISYKNDCILAKYKKSLNKFEDNKEKIMPHLAGSNKGIQRRRLDMLFHIRLLKIGRFLSGDLDIRSSWQNGWDWNSFLDHLWNSSSRTS